MHNDGHTIGSGAPLPPYRWWQMFSRSLFHLRVTGADGARRTYSVDVTHAGDEDGVVRARLYEDGFLHATSKVPAAFPVPGGTIEVAVSGFGLRRSHYVRADGWEQQLAPDPASAEGRRARLDRRHPAISRTIGVATASVLVVAVVLGAPQILEQITQFPPIADNFGTFVSPLQLPAWLNISLVVAGLLASTERALRLRYNWILDGGFSGGGE